MPLRDHFRPPVSKHSSWEGFHGGWPMEIARVLGPHLPDNYVAEPRVHLGAFYEIDVCTFEDQADDDRSADSDADAGGGVATAAAKWTAPSPTLTVESDFPEQYAYEVLIFDLERERTLVAAIEIVSPSNKDRPDHRHLFVAKCANLLRKGVCVSIVDLVTVRRFNLYAELLTMLRRRDRTLGDDPPPTYAATCRKRDAGGKTRLDTWSFPLAVGQPLPDRLPVWLTADLAIPLDLETSYEEACRVLKVRG